MRTCFCLFLALISPLVAARSASAQESATATLAQIVRGGPHLIAVLNFGKLWRGPERESLQDISNLHPVVPSWWLKDLPTKYGIEADAVDRLAVVIHPEFKDEKAAGANVVIISMLTEPKATEALIDKFVVKREPRTHGNRAYWQGGDFAPASAALADPRTALLTYGPVNNLPFFWDQQGELDERWRGFLAKAELTPGLAVHADMVGYSQLLRASFGHSPVAPLLTAQHADFTITAEKGILRIALRGEFPNADSATQAATPLRLVGPLLNGYLQMSATEMPKFFAGQTKEYPQAEELAAPMEQAIEAFRRAVTKAEPRVTGSVAELTFDVETDKPATTTFLLLTLLPRAEKKPGER